MSLEIEKKMYEKNEQTSPSLSVMNKIAHSTQTHFVTMVRNSFIAFLYVVYTTFDREFLTGTWEWQDGHGVDMTRSDVPPTV